MTSFTGFQHRGQAGVDQEHSGGDSGEDGSPEGAAQGAPPHAQNARQAPQQQQEVRWARPSGVQIKESTQGEHASLASQAS